jgi:hypothetical protein
MDIDNLIAEEELFCGETHYPLTIHRWHNQLFEFLVKIVLNP